ncbi:DUF4136 domain-containing protein [Pseudomonadales bacterium]|nr:DUF4136 domain-containing protein [Pseudomonadales bacterium]MDB4150354.1 DUF4136 domain-containing protein [Pseudomonadales bacterium]MDB9867515.1 DUF4136 domain-containing protein [Pseudomonadales bacterium]MDB9917656.1 DUF4136 domain-containing protein [Pseudomonadales bacterium]MDB9943036.1 DUF4136 domain-containing protein [Pseudomonadales bacterium]
MSHINLVFFKSPMVGTTALRRICLLVGVLLLNACATLPHSESAKDVDFSQYRSFAWAPKEVQAVEDPILDSAFMDERVKAAVVSALVGRGFVEDTDNPDMLVTYHSTSKDRIRSVGYGIGLGYRNYDSYWRRSIQFAAPDVESYEEAVLIIDLVDRVQDRLIWRGWRSAALTQKNFSAENVVRMVDKIIIGFPPQ